MLYLQEVLDSLEHIDDDAVNYEISIKLVRMDDAQEAEVTRTFTEAKRVF